MSHSLSFFFAVALSFTASAAFAQTQPQRAAMALGVAQSGVVRAIDVVDGAHVEAGQVLVELDCEPLRKEIDVRAASLAAADAVYERVVTDCICLTNARCAGAFVTLLLARLQRWPDSSLFACALEHAAIWSCSHRVNDAT